VRLFADVRGGWARGSGGRPGLQRLTIFVYRPIGTADQGLDGRSCGLGTAARHPMAGHSVSYFLAEHQNPNVSSGEKPFTIRRYRAAG